jgi:hypothetical protein
LAHNYNTTNDFPKLSDDKTPKGTNYSGLAGQTIQTKNT